MFTNTTLNRLDFGGAATGHFTSERMKRRTCFWCTRGILWELKLFFYVNTFVGGSFIICTKESSFDLFSRIHPWFWSKRRGYTTRNQTTAFCSYKKLYIFCEDMSASFLSAINTDFELLIKLIHNSLPSCCEKLYTFRKDMSARFLKCH